MRDADGCPLCFTVAVHQVAVSWAGARRMISAVSYAPKGFDVGGCSTSEA
jgi:hypothetical protein